MTKMSRTLLAVVLGSVSAASTAVAQTPPPLHVLKIVAGPSGAESNGVFTLAEERLKFSRTSDREVIVFFQWEGVPGPHKLEARWRSSDGGFTSNSTIVYVAAERRFGAYWRIGISPTMQLGSWSIEATVDGQPGGRLNFEIADATVEKGSVPRRPLTPQEMFEAPRANLKGQTSFHVFDPASRPIMSSKPAKANLRKSELVLSSVKIPVPKDPGIYRAEIHLDGKAAWRGFVRITP